MESLDSFFDAASKLPVGTLMRLAAAHQAQDADTLKEARVRAMGLAERLGRQSDTDRLVGAITQWAAASAPTRGQYTQGRISPYAHSPTLSEPFGVEQP